jgi:hypothetical protein
MGGGRTMVTSSFKAAESLYQARSETQKQLLLSLKFHIGNNSGSSPKRVGNLVLLFQLIIYIKGFSEA